MSFNFNILQLSQDKQIQNVWPPAVTPCLVGGELQLFRERSKSHHLFFQLADQCGIQAWDEMWDEVENGGKLDHFIGESWDNIEIYWDTIEN